MELHAAAEGLLASSHRWKWVFAGFGRLMHKKFCCLLNTYLVKMILQFVTLAEDTQSAGWEFGTKLNLTWECLQSPIMHLIALRQEPGLSLFSSNIPVKVQWVKGLSATNGPKKVENNLLFVVLTHFFYVSEPSQDDKLSFMQWPDLLNIIFSLLEIKRCTELP